MQEALLRVLGIMGPYSNYEVFSGTAADTESGYYDLPDGIKRLDIIVVGNPLKVRLVMPGKGASKQIAIPADTVFTVFISPDRFTVQNYTAGSNAIYSIVAWM